MVGMPVNQACGMPFTATSIAAVGGSLPRFVLYTEHPYVPA